MNKKEKGLYMTQQDRYELFKNIQECADLKELKDKIQEFIEENFDNIESINLGDKAVDIIPVDNKPVKIVYKNNDCEYCKEMQIKLKKRKVDEMELEVYICGTCGRRFFV